MVSSPAEVHVFCVGFLGSVDMREGGQGWCMARSHEILHVGCDPLAPLLRGNTLLGLEYICLKHPFLACELIVAIVLLLG